MLHDGVTIKPLFTQLDELVQAVLGRIVMRSGLLCLVAGLRNEIRNIAEVIFLVVVEGHKQRTTCNASVANAESSQRRLLRTLQQVLRRIGEEDRLASVEVLCMKRVKLLLQSVTPQEVPGERITLASVVFVDHVDAVQSQPRPHLRL